MDRVEYYKTGIRNLGAVEFLKLKLQKRLLSTPSTIGARRLDFPVALRAGSSDFDVFDQIFVRDEFRCVSNIQAPKLIIDLGANVGYASAYFLSAFPTCSIVAVEPDPGNFLALKRNLAPYGNRVKAFQAAVWPRNDDLQIDEASIVDGDEWAIKIKPATSDCVRKVTAMTVPQLIEESGFDRVSLMKIDIEGAEINLFSANTEWLDKVDNIVIELHNKEASRTFHEKIKDRHFDVSECDELTVCLG
jgi:FkbM family methyltransferase